MDLGLDMATLLTGVIVFLARVFDVTMGTLRTINTVQGRTKLAFLLGLFEVTMWLVVISAVISDIGEKPILGIFYALGFSTGNVVGILVEQRLALGHVAVRIISACKGAELADVLRKMDLRVTTFSGDEPTGPVHLLFVICQRKEVRKVLGTLTEIDPEAIYTVDMVGPMGRVTRPMMQPATGWRAIIKRK